MQRITRKGSVVEYVNKDFKLKMKKVKSKWIVTGATVLGLAFSFAVSTEVQAAEWAPRSIDEIRASYDESSSVYEVVWGDYLSGISEALEIDMGRLVEIGKIENVDLILEGSTFVFNRNGEEATVTYQSPEGNAGGTYNLDPDLPAVNNQPRTSNTINSDAKVTNSEGQASKEPVQISNDGTKNPNPNEHASSEANSSSNEKNKNRIEELKRQLASLNSQISELETQRASLENQLASIASENAIYDSKVAEINSNQSALDLVVQKIATLNTRLTQLQTDLTAKNAEISNLETILSVATDPDETAQLAYKIEGLRAEAAVMQEGVDETNHELVGLNSQKSELDGILRSLNQSLPQKTDNTELLARLNTVTLEIERLKNEVAALEAELATLTNQNNSGAEEIPSKPEEVSPSEPVEENPSEPVEEEPSEPVEENPSEPVEEEPSEPVEENPSEPVEEEPSEPVEENPSEPVEEEPSEPVEENPSEPAEEEPSEPVEENPSEPVEEEPSEPVEENPSEPVEEEPSEPVEENPSEPVEEKPVDPEIDLEHATITIQGIYGGQVVYEKTFTLKDGEQYYVSSDMLDIDPNIWDTFISTENSGVVVGGEHYTFRYNLKKLKTYLSEEESKIATNELARLINDLRLNVGLNELRVVNALTESAYTRAGEIVIDDEDNHRRPDGSDWTTAIDEDYYSNNLVYAGENTASRNYRETVGLEVAKKIFEQWMDSPGHYANMMYSNYDVFGVALLGKGNGAYAVVNFGLER